MWIICPVKISPPISTFFFITVLTSRIKRDRTNFRNNTNRNIAMFFNGIIRDLVISKFALRTNWRFSTILKTNNKSLCSNVLWYVKVYIFWKFIQYTIHWDKTQKKFLSGKTNATKMHSFFFHEHQPITVLLLIRNSYTSWNTWFIPLKLCVGFSIFDSVSFLLKFMSLFNKMHGLFHFKTSWFLSK